MYDMESSYFDLLSKFSDNYVFLGNMEMDYCRWSQNAYTQLGLPGEVTDARGIWKKLLDPRDYAAFKKAHLAAQREGRRQFSGEYRFLSRNGTYLWMRYNVFGASKDRDEIPEDFFFGTIGNLTAWNTVDPITNLHGEQDFRAELTRLAEQGKGFGALILKIDDLRRINELYTYAFGDAVLQSFAARLQTRMAPVSSLYRLEGECFGILCTHANPQCMGNCFKTFQQIAMQPEEIDGKSVAVTLSGGASFYPADGSNGTEIYRNARVALRSSNVKGHSRFTVYSEELFSDTQRNMQLLDHLQASVAQGFEGFRLNYQPLISAETGELSGCEALLRWSHPDFPEGVTPDDFIPLLESSGMIMDVGKWILYTAFEQCAEWVRYKPDFQMNVNVTSAQFEDPEFKLLVMDVLSRHGLKPSSITLELTESGQIVHPEEVNHAFDFLRSQGLKIAFDDFGTGYSSLGIFRVLSADELKIDRSFLERISYDVTDQKILRQLVGLCHSMNMCVCVEGIESPEMERIVKQFGPELLQGYYYNKPMSPEAFTEFYFRKGGAGDVPEKRKALPEQGFSMVYSDIRPSQPLTTEELVEKAYAGIFQVGLDQEFTFLTCNEGYRQMLGYTAKQMEERFRNHALGFVHPDDMDYVNEEIRRQLGMGDTVLIEFRIVRSDGTPLWILGTGRVVKGAHGSSSLVVVILDNDQRKKQALEMERTYWLYEKILKNVPTGIKCVEFDEMFTIDYISPGFLSQLGYTRQEVDSLFGGKYFNMVYEEDRQPAIDSMQEQLKTRDVVTMRYRSRCKGGQLIWVETVTRICPPDKDGKQRACSNVVNITDTITEEQKQHALQMASRYQKKEKQDILFEYDLWTDAVAFSENYRSVIGRAPSRTLEESMEMLHPDDAYLLRKVKQMVCEGQKPEPVEVRIQNDRGNYQWCSLVFEEPKKKGNTPVSAQGKITDIDAKKREWEKQQEQARFDGITGLLNKTTLEQEIRTALIRREKESYALLLIDMDNFKWLNDNLGHTTGDMVLCATGRQLKVFFQEDAILGRAGGDEFLAFFQYDGNMERLCGTAGEVIQALSQKVGLEEDACRVSVSMGVSCCPLDGLDFYELYRAADSALYRAKELGKNRFCFTAPIPLTT